MGLVALLINDKPTLVLPHITVKKQVRQEPTNYFQLTKETILFTSENQDRYELWSCQNLYEALRYLLDNITFGLVQSYTDKLLAFRWIHIVLFL